MRDAWPHCIHTTALSQRLTVDDRSHGAATDQLALAAGSICLVFVLLSR